MVFRVDMRVNEKIMEEKEVREKLVDGDNDDDFDLFVILCDDRKKSIFKIQEKFEDFDLVFLIFFCLNLGCFFCI